jgi:hypothetical protein
MAAIFFYIKNSKLALSSEIANFFQSAKRNQDYSNSENKQFDLLLLFTELIMDHLDFLRKKIYIDHNLINYLFSPINESDINLESFPRWSIGHPRFIAAWIQYYKGSRAKDFKFSNSEIKFYFWWAIEDITKNDNLIFDSLEYYLFRSKFSYFMNSSYILDSYYLYRFKNDPRFKNFKLNSPSRSKNEKYFSLFFSQQNPNYLQNNDIYTFNKLTKKFISAKIILDELESFEALITSESFIEVLNFSCINDENNHNYHEIHTTRIDLLNFLIRSDETLSDQKMISDEIFDNLLFRNSVAISESTINHPIFYILLGSAGFNMSGTLPALKNIVDKAKASFSRNKINALKLFIDNLPINYESNDSIFSLYNFLEDFDILDAKVHFNQERYLFSSSPKKILPEQISSFKPNIKSIKIIGRLSGILGIAEDARMFSNLFDKYSYDTTRFDTDIFNIPFNSLIKKDSAFTLITMPPWDYIIEKIRHDVVKTSKCTIGYWPWELENIPEPSGYIFEDFDFIFTPSEFVTNCFKKYTNKPVLTLSAPVSIDENISSIRAKNFFQFLIMFDLNSSIYRKNPFPSILAFISIFGNNNDYRLVIKTINADSKIDEFKYLSEMCLNYKNIYIIDKKLTKAEIYSLIAQSHCYISSHRSEGFGRIIAESMLLETPTITSNWSGNTDFCNSNTSILIDGNIVPVKPNEYSFYKDQFWFDPDLDSIKSCLLSAVSNSQNIINNARNFIINSYSYEATMNKFKRFLVDYGL